MRVEGALTGQIPIDGMADAPAPLTPPDCELQDFKFMPLDVARLRSSEQNSDITPEANWAALLLWSAAWHEVPAASIPTNEAWIAKACGYVSLGTINPLWDKVREGALRKFVTCSDGRMYHPVVAEKAREAWAAKLEQRWRTECARIKKHNDRNELKGADAVAKPSYDEWIKDGRPTGQPLPVPKDKTSGPSIVPRDKASKGQGRDRDSYIEDKNPSGSTPAKPGKAARGSKRVPESFEVTPDMVTWAAAEAPHADLVRETAKFRDWEFAHTRTDWAATWRTWMRKASDSAKDRRGHLNGSDETAYQRSRREAVARATGGLASRKPPTDETPHGLQATAPAIAG